MSFWDYLPSSGPEMLNVFLGGFTIGRRQTQALEERIAARRDLMCHQPGQHDGFVRAPWLRRFHELHQCGGQAIASVLSSPLQSGHWVRATCSFW